MGTGGWLTSAGGEAGVRRQLQSQKIAQDKPLANLCTAEEWQCNLHKMQGEIALNTTEAHLE